jgi:hypothetical protein
MAKKYLDLDGLSYVIGRLKDDDDGKWHDLEYSDTTFSIITELMIKKTAGLIIIKVSGASAPSEALITIAGRISADGFSQCFLATGGIWAAALREETDKNDNVITVISFAKIIDIDASSITDSVFENILGGGSASDSGKGGIIMPPIAFANIIDVSLIIPIYKNFDIVLPPAGGVDAEEKGE